MFANYMVGGGAPFAQAFALDAVDGCTDPASCNYDSAATCDDGSCACLGCTYLTSLNYDPTATVDDGSCLFAEPSDCATDINWDGMVSVNDILLVLTDFGSNCE